MMEDKIKNTLKFIYKKAYNNGEFIDLIGGMKKIKKINEIYSGNFENNDTIEDLFSKFGDYNVLLEKSPAAICEIRKQFKKNKALQPSILTECFISQSLANLFNLECFADADDSSTSIPISITQKMNNFKGYTDSSSFRYIYYSLVNDCVLTQCGDSSTIDAYFIKSRTSIRIEYKECVSKLGEFDITGLYGEDGKLIISPKFEEERNDYIPFVDMFNNLTDIFSHIGSNFKFAEYMTNDNAKHILSRTFNENHVDLVLFADKKKIFPVISSEVYSNVDVKGSEIRPSGRNASNKIFTPKYAARVLSAKGAIIDEDGNVRIEKQKMEATIGRGKTEITRFKLCPLLFVKSNCVDIINNVCVFKYSDIQQLKPSIAIHLNAFFNEESYRRTIEILK